MINWKVLFKALVPLLCFCFYSNTVTAGTNSNWNNHTWNNDVDYYADSYLESAPDAVMTDWHWSLAGDPNNGDTTDDGFCFMFYNNGDPYAIYNAIEPTRCAFWQHHDYANAEWINFSDLNMIAQPDPAPIGIYQEQQSFVGVSDDKTNIFGSGSSYWTGCFSTGDSPTWADGQGQGGGECPIINNAGGQINWGYMEQSLTQISAIDTALKNAGLETYGYTYSWMVKNADANFEDTNGADGQDTLTVTIAVKDNGGKIVYEKEYDYSYWIDTWTEFSGEDNFDTPFDLKTLDSIMLQVTGQDVGDWEGWYGPEFNNPNVVLKYRPIIEDNTEELLFEQMCLNDPLYDMNCPGYQNAMMEQMTEATGGLANAVNNGGGDAFGNDLAELEGPTGESNALAQARGTPVNAGTNDGQDMGSADPIAKAAETGVPDPVAEVQEKAIADATPDPVAEAQKQAIAKATPDPVKKSQESVTEEAAATGGGLNATQLSALDAANNVAGSAVASATGAARMSAGIGLSETGGVSSALTAVDTTGSTTADGGITGGSNFEFGGGSSADGGTTVAGLTQNVGTSQNFSGGQNSGNTQGLSGSNNGAGNDGTGSSNGSDNGSNTGSMGFNNTQTAGGVVEQSGNPLASGGSVETNDITGEDALAVSNEATLQVAALNDPTNPINQIINDIAANLITQAVDDANEVAEESAEESVESQNAQEDALVAEALAGSDNEDAQSALLGYNPNFRAYQQPQMLGGDIYVDQGVYEDQKNYDNPNARFFNGASDATHRKMVRQQYERN